MVAKEVIGCLGSHWLLRKSLVAKTRGPCGPKALTKGSCTSGNKLCMYMKSEVYMYETFEITQ